MDEFVMDPDFVEYLKTIKGEKKCSVPGLLKNLEERSLALSRKNVSTKEYRELIAEEIFVNKEKFDELHCEMPGAPRSTFLMVFSPDGTKVASTHGNHNIYITDVRSGKNLKTLVGHPRTPWCIAFHPTSNQIVASGCLGGQVRIWDLSGGSEIWTAKSNTVIASIAFHPIERILVIATSNEVYFWDWSKPEPFMHTSTGSQKEKVRYVAFDKLGQRLITGISNSHNRWEYVRSSERTSERPVRHFNIASRRPAFRRGIFPVRQHISLSSSNNDPSDARSRVPERERNITVSYRNLVRQYGRLVQRYLQLYRPPAMIDRGTDPMENATSSNNMMESAAESNAEATGSSSTSEVQESNLTTGAQEYDINSEVRECDSNVQGSNDTTEVQESSTTVLVSNSSVQVQVSNNTAKIQEPNRTTEMQEPTSTTEVQEPTSTTEVQEPNINTEVQEPNIATEVQETGNTTESHVFDNTTGMQETSSIIELRDSDDSESTSGPGTLNDNSCYNPTPACVQLPRKHKRDHSPQNIILQKRLKLEEDDSVNQSRSTSESPQPSTSGLSQLENQAGKVRELSRAILSKLVNMSKTDPSVQPVGDPQSILSDLVADITEDSISHDLENNPNYVGLGNQETSEPSFNPVLNVEPDQLVNMAENGDSSRNTDPEGVTENSNQEQIENEVQTDRVVSLEPSITRIDTELSGDPDVERIYRHMIRSLDVASGGMSSSRFNESPDSATSQPVVESQSVDNSSTTNDPVPGSSGVSQESFQRRLENMMMNMRRKAEDNLRARLMPLIRSRVPEHEREGLVRLFEASIRESRERARARYRLMVEMCNRQPTREQRVFSSSDSSSSDDGRDPLHMNFYIQRINEDSSRASDSGTSSRRSRGSALSGGNNSYQNINNLESWVTSLFNDVDSPTTEEMGADSTQTTRSISVNEILDLLPRTNPHLSLRNRESLNVSISTSRSSMSESTNQNTTNISSSDATSERRNNNLSAFSPTRTGLGTRMEHEFSRERQARRERLCTGLRRLGLLSLQANSTTDTNFARDEVINFSEFPNSENPTPERPENFSPSQPSFHPFNPPPNLPTINPENIGIGNMYSNIIRDLERSLYSARDTRSISRPGEMSNMLGSFSNRLETLMNQSESILRNLRTSVEVLPDNDVMEYGEDPPIPTASYNDSSFFVREQGVEEASSVYDTRQNNATSDHTYPRNSDSPSTSSNLNDAMAPLMNSLHRTLHHIQSQSRLLHRQVESIERIDRAMVEVSQIQLMRLLLGELSSYVRNASGESRSTSMSSVRQMMAGTRISDSNPGSIQNRRETVNSRPTNNPIPSTSSGLRSSHQSSSARSRGLVRKTYPPSRLYRPVAPSSEPSSNHTPPTSSSSTLPSVAPTHTFSVINAPTLVRMERRLQSIIDDHSSRFSYLTDLLVRSNSPRRLVHELGEHNVALRLRESIARTNRLIGNILNVNIVRNYRIDASTSLRHGINRYYERTFLSLIIDGISSHLDNNREHPMTSEIRIRMQSVLQLAMLLADLLLLYTIISLTPTAEVSLELERRLLASRIEDSCSTIIHSRRSPNVFIQSLRSLRLMVSVYCESSFSNVESNTDRRERHSTSGDHSLARSIRARLSATSARLDMDRQRVYQRIYREHYNNIMSGGRISSNNGHLSNSSIMGRRQRVLDQSSSNGLPELVSQQNRQTRNRENTNSDPSLLDAVLYLNRQSLDTTSSETNRSQNEDANSRTRRRNSTDHLINTYLTAGRSRHPDQSTSNEESDSQPNSSGNLSTMESIRNRIGFNPYRDIALITSRSTNPSALPGNSRGSQDPTYRNPSYFFNRGRLPSSSRSRGNSPPNPSETSERLNNSQNRVEPSVEPQAGDLNLLDSWLNSDELPILVDPSEETSSFGSPTSRLLDTSLLPTPLSPIQSRPSTSSNPYSSESARYWRIPSVQVNDVPVSDIAPALENSDSDNSSTAGGGINSGNPAYPRVMARLAAFRSHLPLHNPMGLLRPRLLHPLYSALNPFDDMESRDHIYDSDVISTVTPNHRIQVWDMSDSVIPNISDPLKNLVVRECKIHNDASVDISSDGSILVTLLPSGGYLNITNRLGIYSLRWETLGQCLYTTNFVHNAVSVSLSPLGRHLIVALASRRVSILPNDRWMMASIYKIEDKDSRSDHLPFLRQIERGRNEPSSHRSVNCIRWLPTSGQGLIYATNTGQLNIWT